MDLGGTWLRIAGANRAGKIVATQRRPAPDTIQFPVCIKNFIKTHCRTKPVCMVIGARGAWSSQAKNKFAVSLNTLAENIFVISDIELAYWNSFADGPGIALIAGTGSVALGRDTLGNWRRAGGLGPQIGDEGSAYWIAGKYFDKRAAADSANIRRLARRTVLIMNRYSIGEPKAVQIVNQAAEHLAKLAEDVSRRLDFKGRIPLSLCGGLFKCAKYRRAFEQKMNRLGYRITRPELNAEECASLLGRSADTAFRIFHKLEKMFDQRTR